MSATCTVPLWPEETWPVFIFRAMLLRREHFDARSTRASDDMAAVQYFGNGTDAFAHPRRAGFARNPPATPFDGNPTRFVFVFVPRATASDHFPPPVHAQLPRCTWPRRPLSAWASASSPVPSGRYASRPAEPEPRRAIAGPRHPAAPPPETEKYPQHSRGARFSFDIRTIFISADPTPRSSPRRTGTGRPSARWRRSTPRASERSGRRALRKRQSVVFASSRREDVGNET